MFQEMLFHFKDRSGYLDRKLERCLLKLEEKLVSARQATAQSLSRVESIEKSLGKATDSYNALIRQKKKESVPTKLALQAREQDIEIFQQMLNEQSLLSPEILNDYRNLEEFVFLIDCLIRFVLIVSLSIKSNRNLFDIKDSLVECTNNFLKNKELSETLKPYHLQRKVFEFATNVLDERMVETTDAKKILARKNIDELETNILTELPKHEKNLRDWKSRAITASESGDEMLIARASSRVASFERQIEFTNKVKIASEKVKNLLDCK